MKYLFSFLTILNFIGTTFSQLVLRKIQATIMFIGIIVLCVLLNSCENITTVKKASIAGQTSMSKKITPSTEGIFHCSFPDFGGTEDTVLEQRITDFENLVGKKIVWAYFSNNWHDNSQSPASPVIIFPSQAVQIIHDHGAIPFIRMMPRSNFDEGGPDPIFTMQRIIDGQFDADLLQWAMDAKATGFPLMVEFGTEVNGDWFPWNGLWNGGGIVNQYGDPTLADGPERFKDAYRHIIDLFRDQNVDNITWVFHVDAYSWPENSWNSMQSYYPGDDYVDWIGISVYGPQVPGEEWQSFVEIMDDSYPLLEALSPSKPLAILEFGTTDDGTGKKAVWIEEALAAIRSQAYPRIKAISYWHETFTNDDGSISNLRLDSSPEALQAYRDGINYPIFITQAPIDISNQPPAVSITSPQNGAQYTEGSTISITANASDSDGSITRVEFFQDSTKLGEDTTAPYAYTWSNVPAGSYALTAVAYDDDGAHTTSTPVGISVNQSGGAITVTESSHDGSNIAQNTLDNNLGTKWSALGIGQWVQYDLRSVKLIDSVEIAFYRGTEIVYYFDIEVSNNGTTWTKVYTGQNSKQTLNLELFAFAMTSARYVKIVGKGNWWHAWNRYTEVKVNSIITSASSYDGIHVPENTLDGNLTSYWSAWGIGEWIQYDLGRARIIDSVDIAFERGNIIKYYFDIEVSLDGVTWTKVYIGQNSGTTAGLELYDFAEVKARYVKIIGKGNMWHEWNRPTEVKINSIITSASSYDGTYVPENTLDGNLNSYWSAWGIGEWIQYDLQRTRTIKSVELAFERGDLIEYSFDIEVSMDGTNWTKVYTGQNSGTTLGLELFNFTDVSARYVKLVGKGNIWHEWNRYMEVKIDMK